MWSIYGIDSPNVEGVTNPKSIIIGNFKPSSSISEADFNNASNTFLCQNYISLEPAPGQYKANSNKYSSYVEDGSFPSNLLGYNRFNILHRVSVSGGQIEYEYDKCYYLWTYHTSGTNLYYFDAYRKDSLSYSHCPAVAYERYTNNAITRNYVRSMQLIATRGNGEAGIGVVRPLWGFNFSDINYFSENPVQYILGPVIPSATIDEWLRGSKKEDNPDAPVKPLLNPEDANQHSAHSDNYTWANKFKIMNWAGSLPSKFLIDGYPASSDDFIQNYCMIPSDSPSDYYVPWSYTGDSTAVANFWYALQGVQTNFNTRISEAGHDVNSFYDHYFVTLNNGIDNISPAPPLFPSSYERMSSSLPSPKKVDIGDFVLDYTGYSGNYETVNYIKFDGFSISQNYSNNTQLFYCGALNSGGGTPPCFLDCCIIRNGGNYYLGGFYKWGSGYSAGGLVILCQMSRLKSKPGYAGPNPGDPQPTSDPDNDDGINAKKLDGIFGDGTGTEENPNTESIINGNIGDYTGTDGEGSAGDGSAYNPDGTPKNPADDSGSGTGEKNSNPVDSHAVPNSHDGSMGNGTGDPHGGDTAITDPSGTLPSGVETEGTVTGSGVLQVFTPSLAELNSFTSELLSSSVLNAIKNYFTTNPMDGIFGLHILPYTGFSGTATANPRIGTHNFTAALTLASSEFITVDYGEVYIPFVYDGYENYAPFSDAKIFLPFIGTKDIDINVIQGSKCKLKYNVSLVTGDIYAYMYCQWAGKWGSADVAQGVDHLMYSWQGNCAATIPLSHLDSTNYISGAMQIAGGITSITAGIATTNPMAIVGGVGALSNGMAERGRTSLVTSGNISGMAAFMGCREPYFIISRPIVAFSEAYNHYLGQRSNAIQRIDQLRPGTFTIMRNVDLAGISADEEEIKEMDAILKGGFYV